MSELEQRDLVKDLWVGMRAAGEALSLTVRDLLNQVGSAFLEAHLDCYAEQLRDDARGRA